jgi:redox-sensitive bicupin YhaK (pirin superfamily)
VDVVNLLDGRPFDPHAVLSGPWRWLRVATVEPGAVERLEPGEVEYTVYVIDGEGDARLAGDRTVPIRAGSALTLLKGAEATLTAENGPLRAFLVAIDT